MVVWSLERDDKWCCGEGGKGTGVVEWTREGEGETLERWNVYGKCEMGGGGNVWWRVESRGLNLNCRLYALGQTMMIGYSG